MRTLQEKYNAIQEGKFSKDHFLAEARMQQPQLVTRFNGYDDAVQILKNKGMIVEAAKVTSKNYKGLKYEIQYEAPKGYKVVGVGELEKAIGSPKFYKTLEEAKERAESDIRDYLGEKETVKEAYSTEESFKDYSDDALTDMIINSSRFEGNEDGIARVKAELERRKQAKNVNEVTPAQEKYRVKPPTQFKQDIAAAKKMIDAGKSEKEVVAMHGQAAFNAVNAQNLGEARLTNKSLTDYRYKPTNDMDKYPYEQILRGIRVELEVLGVSGTPTAEEYSKALAKVSKNLAKDSIFYTNQVAGVNPNVDLHDKMVPVTAKNSVDTFNGMKKAALKEGFKKLIKKVLSETVVDVEDYNGEDEFDMYGDDEADDIPHPRGYEEASDEEDLDESAMGDIYQIAKEHDRFEHFVQAVEDEFGPVEDIAELEHIFNSTRGEDDINYGDENFSDAEIDTEYEGDPGYKGYESPSDRAMKSDNWVQAQRDMMETRKAKPLSELLK
jgi:hypothetical protein